jgi:hypothetical protein
MSQLVEGGRQLFSQIPEIRAMKKRRPRSVN